MPASASQCSFCRGWADLREDKMINPAPVFGRFSAPWGPPRSAQEGMVCFCWCVRPYTVAQPLRNQWDRQSYSFARSVSKVGEAHSLGRTYVAGFWTVFYIFNSRFDRWVVRWGVRGRQFRPFPADFGGSGGVRAGNKNIYMFNSFQKPATLMRGF